MRFNPLNFAIIFKYLPIIMFKMTAMRKRALNISYFSVIYHILEGLASVLAGASAGSIALLGFGLDSFVESLSGFIVIGRLQKHGNLSKQEEEKMEKRALKLIAYTFFVLAIYVFYESVKRLYLYQIPKPSLLGIIIAIISLIVMPILFFMKRKTGKLIKSHSLVADSKQQLACIMLSVALLVGLGLNYFFGFWQADPLIGLAVFIYLVNEGVATLKEEKVCGC